MTFEFSLPFLIPVAVMAASRADEVKRRIVAALMAAGHNAKTAANSIHISEAQLSRRLDAAAQTLGALIEIDPDIEDALGRLFRRREEVGGVHSEHKEVA